MCPAVPQREMGEEQSWRAAVGQWLTSAPSEFEMAGFAQIDVDDLLAAEPPAAVLAALFCMDLAVTDQSWAATPIEGLVVVPLEPRRRGTGQIPRLSHVLSGRWRYGPGRSVPGIYLLTPAAWAAYEPVEEYRVDLGTEGLGPGHVAYFRAWRNLHGEDDFDRALYIRRLAR